ncbi:M48 family metallopeptidase [Telmatobacter sp. DSM 110680]|uniref:M48 family metallopeptidase n=1 Tax=Telmatobacter sp. DSM 110680 TaxID=3036704 RepID=A0AAU7DK55_9BACT
MFDFSKKILAFALIAGAALSASAQPAIQPTVDITKVPAAAQASPQFDTDAATEAYMGMMPPAAVARSNAYFEGGYWLILWDFLYGVAVSLLLLNLLWSARMRDMAVRVTRYRWLQPLPYAILFVLADTVLGFPLEYYENYAREHKYGLATQSFGPWMGDEFKELLVSLVIASIAMLILFAIVRRFPNSWWIWGAAATMCLMTILIAIGPVFLQPIFNSPKKLEDPKITAPILRMAHANGIPTNDVWQIDASRQTTRMSANVSGFGNTMRITLNDNLIQRGSPEEIQAVMGHEMGHYVMNHISKILMFFLILIVLSFAYLFWGIKWALSRWGERWQISSVSDPAVVPLVMLMVSILMFVLTPINNSFVRMQEKEADMFGLNASRQPDGFAQAAIHLGEYRKMRPGPIEEFLFYDHPSGYNRIHSAMVWKSQNLELFKPSTEQISKP